MRHDRAVRRRATTTIAVTAALLTACGTTPDTGGSDTAGLPEPERVRLDRPAIAAPDDVPVPALADPVPVWSAPFDDVPFAAGDMLVGLRFPTDDESDLSVVGVEPDGRTTWAVRTNPACVGFGVTSVGGRPAAVVLASDADNRRGRIATTTTAGAYDAEDGHRLWGPVEVPGPLQGPGLIFGEVTGSVVGGEAGSRRMLATDTGESVEPPVPESVPVYEHHGTGVFAHDDALTAVDTHAGDVRWTSADLDRPTEWPGSLDTVALADGAQTSDSGVVALRWGGGGRARTSLHEVGTGALIADLADTPEPRVTVDPRTRIVVVGGLDDGGVTRAWNIDTGTELWEHGGRGGPLDLTVTGHGVGHGTHGGHAVAVDLRGGHVLRRDAGPVPVAASDGGVLVTALPPDGPTDRVAGGGPGYVAHRAR